MKLKKKRRPPFQYLDAKVRFNYKSDLLAKIKELGYKYVSEYVYDQYYKKFNPISEIAKNLPITNSVVFSWMRRWEFPTRSKGGNTKNTHLLNPRIISKIKAAKGKKTVTDTAKKYNCSDTSVRNIWKRKKP